MMLPMIHQALKTDTRLLKLDPNEFTTRGARQSYAFKLEIIDGLIPVKKGLAVARDLKTVLDASPTFCKFAKGKTMAQFKSSVEIQSQLLAKYCTYTI